MTAIEQTDVVDNDTPADTSSALERIETDALVPYHRPPIFPSVDEFGFIMQMAEALSRGNLVPAACRNKPADVAIVLLGARDLGIPMTQAFTKLHVIDGKLSISAELMVALALRDGHRVWCEELNGELATACAQRKGSEHVARFTFTIDDAQTAGLLGKDNWQHYPKAMLWARACSGVVRMELPDVTAGITYTPEEVGDNEHFTAHPASALDQSIREDFASRARALPEAKQEALKAEMKTWGLNPVARMTVEEERTMRTLLERAEAIDVDSQETPGDAPSADPGDTTDPTQEAVRSDPDAAVVTPGAKVVWPSIGGGGSVDTPDPTAIQHDADVEGPSVFNGDTGKCSECGAPIWYAADERDGGPGWLHADPEDACSVRTVEPAGPGIDADALYAATHKPPDPKERELLIKTDVGKMSQTAVLQALNEAGLSIEGSPRTLKSRLVEHRLAP